MNTNSTSNTDTDTDSIVHTIRRKWIHQKNEKNEKHEKHEEHKKHTQPSHTSTGTLCKLYEKLLIDCFEKDQRDCRNLFDNMIQTCYEE